ncbi:uncharacterized protein MONOS_18473 [Monocercomonoides exilis]|uniref:uncharacterized protein n=1 Tax=Monocercomonoides exilis TaxID=2049356 RepID=UPI0035595F6B|nr:hypothetical protein MONOS_18473 [Monocercomonoides exilis]
MVSLGQCSLGAEVMLGGIQISRCSFIVCVRGQLSLVDVAMKSASTEKAQLLWALVFVRSRTSRAHGWDFSERLQGGAKPKGGAVFVKLGEGGRFSVMRSTMMRCCCSDEGKGGVFYIEAMRSGVLDFVFQSVSFAGNTAKVGNDIYVSCQNITAQINETQFRFDLREGVYVRQNAIYGIDATDHIADTNLMDFITIYQSDTIVVSSLSEYGGKTRDNFDSRLIVDGGTFIEEDLTLDRLLLASRSKSQSNVTINSIASSANEAVIATLEAVSIANLWFIFEQDFVCSHSSFISPRCGVVELANCSFSSESSLPLFSLLDFSEGNGTITSCLFSSLTLLSCVIHVSSSCFVSVASSEFCLMSSAAGAIVCENSKEISVAHTNCGYHTFKLLFLGITTHDGQRNSGKICVCPKVLFDLCELEGNKNSEVMDNSICNTNELCSWNGSLADVQNSTSTMKDTTIANSSIGGMSVFGGSMMIEDGKFMNNNPKIENYQSVRRNIVCSGSGLLKVASVKGGDGVKEGSSLWVLNEGCTLGGIAEERESVFFIPELENVEAEEDGSVTRLKFVGLLLVPCNLSFRVVKRVGSEELVERYSFEEGGFVSEAEVLGAVPSKTIYEAGEETEVSVCILFGNAETPSSTKAFVLKNGSDPKASGDGKLAEGGKDGKLSWALIVIVMFAVLFLIAFVGFILFVVRWRKQKRRTKELEVIVEDTVRKDPKTENGSTEYILGRDSDKIPQWALEKMEDEDKDEEDTRKRTPSPSISSTSTTDTLDTDSSFLFAAGGTVSNHLVDVESVSSSSIATSSSDISLKSERFTDSPPPSSAFEDDEDYWKECLRWKAPELLSNKKLGAERKTVAFSIGMMLWECLSLKIPFGEFEAKTAGQKIMNGERPPFVSINNSSLIKIVDECLSFEPLKRPTLINLKREFIQMFPDGSAMLTVSDAIDICIQSDVEQ